MHSFMNHRLVKIKLVYFFALHHTVVSASYYTVTMDNTHPYLLQTVMTKSKGHRHHNSHRHQHTGGLTFTAKLVIKFC